VGETVAKKLALTLHNIEALETVSFEELITIEEIGDRIARSILDFFANQSNQKLVNRLKSYGLNFQIDEQKVVKSSNKLDGKSIVISGTFAKYSRDELKNMVEQHGGKNVASVSAKTDFILAGENMGPSKFEKAQKLGVKLITEDEFLLMLD
jgi:DNA ligase (NAD+)